MDKIWWIILGALIGFLIYWIVDFFFCRGCKCKCAGGCQKNATDNSGMNNSTFGSMSSSNAPTSTNTMSGLTSAVTTGAGAAATVTTTKKDDLKIIEGIGPKIAELLNDAGIHSFADLASTPLATLNAVLEKAGPKFNMAKPDTWAEQAALLAKGDKAAFDRLTQELTGGVRK